MSTAEIAWEEVPLLLVAGALILHLNIAVHELGHWLAGVAVGIRSSMIVVGEGPTMPPLRLGSLICHWRLFPTYGFVRPMETAANFMLGRRAAFLLGGVGANAAILWILILVYSDVSQLPPWQEHLLIYTWFLAVMLAGSAVIDNLVPRLVTIAGQRIPNDGLKLRQLWKERTRLPQLRQLARDGEECRQLLERGDISSARALLARLSAMHPDNVSISFAAGQVDVLLKDVDGAFTQWSRTLEIIGGSPEQRAQVLDHLASLVLIHGRADRLSDADRWSDEAMRLQPASTTLRGTRGCVLIELGRSDAGRALLREVIATSTSPVDLAISEVYLAWLAAREGRSDDARRLLASARQRQPDLGVVRRIAGEVARASGGA